MTENNLSKFERAIVTFAPGVFVDCYETPSGEFRIGMTGASKVLGFAKNWLGRVTNNPQLLDSLVQMGFSGEIVTGFVTGKTGKQLVSTISESDFRVLVSYAASTGNKKALELIGVKTVQSLRKSQQTEAEVRNRLASILENAKIEVACPAGRIDILTNSEIIKVKNINDWKSAIGQVLVYGDYYPDRVKRIHLFGESQDIRKTLIAKHANKLNISVSFE